MSSPSAHTTARAEDQHLRPSRSASFLLGAGLSPVVLGGVYVIGAASHGSGPLRLVGTALGLVVLVAVWRLAGVLGSSRPWTFAGTATGSVLVLGAMRAFARLMLL